MRRRGLQVTSASDVLMRARAALRRHALDALDERGLIRGMRVEFPRPQACRLGYFEEAGPGAREMLVESLATVVSPGTERAIYVRAETIACTYPFVPGYSCTRVNVGLDTSSAFAPRPRARPRTNAVLPAPRSP